MQHALDQEMPHGKLAGNLTARGSEVYAPVLAD
jgi:hypothetical protein